MIVFQGEAVQNCQARIYGRFCSPNGTGASSPVAAKEGNLIKQVDVSNVAINAFGSDDTQNGTTQTPAPSAVINNTFQTTGVWKNCPGGGNFSYQCPASFFPTGGDIVKVQVVLTLTDGTLAPGLFEVTVTKKL